MSKIYVRETLKRREFVSDYLTFAKVADRVRGKSVLIKPNIVSLEPYPTTTHPETLDAVLEYLSENTDELVVADGPAFESRSDLAKHQLALVCKSYDVDLVDLSKRQMRTVETKSGFSLEVSDFALGFDFMISLPVLKCHSACSLTGALKNHYGLLSTVEKRAFHFNKAEKLHMAIAELSRLRKADVYVVDAVETLVKAQERRHGGKVKKLGYMAAASDPVSLDSWGLDMLKSVEKKLRKNTPNEILHLKYAIDFGVGEAEVTLQNF